MIKIHKKRKEKQNKMWFFKISFPLIFSNKKCSILKGVFKRGGGRRGAIFKWFYSRKETSLYFYYLFLLHYSDFSLVILWGLDIVYSEQETERRIINKEKFLLLKAVREEGFKEFSHQSNKKSLFTPRIWHQTWALPY